MPKLNPQTGLPEEDDLDSYLTGLISGDDGGDMMTIGARETEGDPPAPPPDVPEPQPEPAPTPAPAPAPEPESAYDPTKVPLAANPTKMPMPSATPGGLTFGPNGKFIFDIFGQQGKTPTQKDLDYWEDVIKRAGGDMGYVRRRMLEPDTGGQRTGGGGPGTNQTATGPMNFTQARAYVEGKLGHALTDAQVDEAFRLYGGNRNSTFTADSLAPVISHFGGPSFDLTGDTRVTRVPGDGNSGGGNGEDAFSSFLQQLMTQYSDLYNRYSRPVSRDDPYLRPVIDARQGASGRALNRFQEKAAERAHSEGTGTGAFDTQVLGANALMGQGDSDFEANLMNNEQARRDSVLSSIFGQGIGVGGLGSANQLGNRGLTIQDFLGRGGLSNQLFLGQGNLLARLREGDQQDRQFYDNLAARLGMQGSDLDALLTRLLLGG